MKRCRHGRSMAIKCADCIWSARLETLEVIEGESMTEAKKTPAKFIQIAVDSAENGRVWVLDETGRVWWYDECNGIWEPTSNDRADRTE